MRTYPQRVARHILPLSVAQTLPAAFDEWQFTGRLEDHEGTSEVCELCEQEGLRYQFEIANDITFKKMMIGSQCILRFEIAVYDENGRRLSLSGAKRRLERLKKELRHAACLKALATLAAFERNDMLSGALARLEHHGSLTPRQAWVVFWKLKQRSIEHHPEFFKINLRRWVYRKDLAMMEPERVTLLWPALTPAQRKVAQSLTRAAAPSAVFITSYGSPPVMIGPAAANGWSYGAMLLQGWTDALLVAHGYMQGGPELTARRGWGASDRD